METIVVKSLLMATMAQCYGTSSVSSYYSTSAVNQLNQLPHNDSFPGSTNDSLEHANDVDVGANWTDSFASTTQKAPPIWGPKFYSTSHLIVTSIILGLMILATIIGNVFVIAAVVLERNLHSVANYLILSLAVADLMVASMVMPISAVNEVSYVWFFSAAVCDMWISFDVLCCTASILHLVGISIDRYWAVTNIDYIRNRSARTIIIIIAMAWVTALCISIPPLFGWKVPENHPYLTGMCIISQDLGYTVFSTVGAFYVPMLIMMVIYARIYQVARARIRKDNFTKKYSKVQTKEAKRLRRALCSKKKDVTVLTAIVVNPSSCLDSMESSKNGTVHATLPKCDRNSNGTKKEQIPRGCLKNGSTVTTSDAPSDTTATVVVVSGHEGCASGDINSVNVSLGNCTPKSPDNTEMKRLFRDKQREKIELKRERKAARTLGIITGCFIICWLPFFIIAFVAPFCGDRCTFPKILMSIVLWLGYFNSLLNPIIYTIFSPEFREAFRKILFGKYRGRHRSR